jgi:hypothetical protein
MEPALILANRILELLRESGASKIEAYCALEVAHKVLPAVKDMAFNHRADLEVEESGVADRP